MAAAAAPPPPPRHLELRVRVPRTPWPVLRAGVLGLTLALCWLLVARPVVGLTVLWSLVVPLLPLAFLATPGLWRNLCPMTTVNQAPRFLGRTRGRPMPPWLRDHGYAIALGLFLLLVPARHLVFDTSGPASALLVGSLLAVALAGGAVFKGKAGWCASVCPLRPVQGLYARAPLLTTARSHCLPCTGCTKNCPDLKPGAAQRHELRDRDAFRSRPRLLVAGALPGLILAHYLRPALPVPELLAPHAAAGLGVLLGLGAFFLVETFVRIEVTRLVTTFAALSFALFAWFNVPIVIAGVERLLALEAPGWLTFLAREHLILLAVAWHVRSRRADRALPVAVVPVAADEPTIPVASAA
jgi:nitrite reductase (NADH) large subunit